MSYDFIKHYIGVDIQRVQEASKELQAAVPLELYIKILTLHELGHAADRKALLASLPRTVEIHKMKKSHSLAEQYHNVDLLAMRIEQQEMDIVFEKTAWANAENMNRQYGIADGESFEKVKAHSLLTYTRLHDRDLELYAKLTATHNEKIA